MIIIQLTCGIKVQLETIEAIYIATLCSLWFDYMWQSLNGTGWLLKIELVHLFKQRKECPTRDLSESFWLAVQIMSKCGPNRKAREGMSSTGLVRKKKKKAVLLWSMGTYYPWNIWNVNLLECQTVMGMGKTTTHNFFFRESDGTWVF